MTATVVALGLVNWLVTTILVESELFKPLRRWVRARYEFHRFGPRRAERSAWWDLDLDRNLDRPFHARRTALWHKVDYLVGCHLCAGTWIGIALAGIAGGPFAGVVGIILNGLLYKAIGHLTLETSAFLAGRRRAV